MAFSPGEQILRSKDEVQSWAYKLMRAALDQIIGEKRLEGRVQRPRRHQQAIDHPNAPLPTEDASDTEPLFRTNRLPISAG
ncbi:MAG: hypothetical protein ACRDJ9_36460, partial [Dehalococcoidia bacterium]